MILGVAREMSGGEILKIMRVKSIRVCRERCYQSSCSSVSSCLRRVYDIDIRF